MSDLSEVDAHVPGSTAWHLKNEMGGFMASEKMREEFEAAVIAEFKTVGVDSPDLCRGSNGDYLNNVVGGAWWAWQASRASLVIDLSDLSQCFSPNDCGDWAMWLDDVRILVQAVGLKVKP